MTTTIRKACEAGEAVDPVARRTDDLAVEFWGIKIHATGRHIINIVAMLLIGVALGAGLYAHDGRTAEQTAKAIDGRDKQLGEIVKLQKRLEDKLDDLIWINMLSPEDKKKYKLDMPPSMRAKLLKQERER